MDMDGKNFDEHLVALRFFSLVLQRSPDEGTLRQIIENGLFEDFRGWECFRPAETEGKSAPLGADPGQSLEILAKRYSSAAAPDDYRRLYLDLHLDHLALFSGPAPKAPPWESVWRERDKLLFGERTDKVSKFYSDWGISVDNAGHDPEDHLGLETAFALFLLRTALGDPFPRAGRGLGPLAALVLFLDEHVLPWAGLCLEKAREEAATDFYREIPVLCWTELNNLSLLCRGVRGWSQSAASDAPRAGDV